MPNMPPVSSMFSPLKRVGGLLADIAEAGFNTYRNKVDSIYGNGLLSPVMESVKLGLLANQLPAEQKLAVSSMAMPFPYGDVAGLTADAMFYKNNPGERNWQNYALSGLGLLPFVPGVTKLPMDEASRMTRAKEMGFDTGKKWYHGTTHEFDEFGAGKHNPEGYFGSGHYFTSDVGDARMNYSGEGPDLTGRIEQRKDQLDWELEDNPEAFGLTADEIEKRGKDVVAREIAEKELKGGAEGRVIEAHLRGKTVDVTDDNPTWLEYNYSGSPEEFMDDAKEYLDKTDYMDDGVLDKEWYESDLYDKAVELAQEDAMYRDPTGELADFINSINDQSYDYDFDAGEVIGAIQEEAYDGGIHANRLNEILRKNEGLLYAENRETGQLVGQDILRKAFYDAGYPNILMDASKAFPNMDIGLNVKHMITSDPKNIRSTKAAFDPEKSDSANILATMAGMGLLGAYAYPQDQAK